MEKGVNKIENQGENWYHEWQQLGPNFASFCLLFYNSKTDYLNYVAYGDV